MVLPVDDKPNEGRTSYGSNVVFATPEAWWQIKKRALSQVNQRVQRGRMPLPLQTRLEIHMAVAVTSFDRWGLCTYGILSSFCPLKNVSFTTVLPETVLSARNIVVWINNVTRSLSSFPGGQMVKTLYFHWGHAGSVLGQRVPHATWPEKKRDNKIPVLNGTSQKK